MKQGQAFGEAHQQHNDPSASWALQQFWQRSSAMQPNRPPATLHSPRQSPSTAPVPSHSESIPIAQCLLCATPYIVHSGLSSCLNLLLRHSVMFCCAFAEEHNSLMIRDATLLLKLVDYRSLRSIVYILWTRHVRVFTLLHS